MTIRHGLLALLAQGPQYGYQMRAEFEQLTGTSWPLNAGQVYATLSRLERDGLATRVGADDEGRFVYRITAEGVREVERWYDTPVARAERSRDEVSIKVALAMTTPGVDVHEVVQAQRTATLHSLRDLAVQKADAAGAGRLVVESRILQAEAELCWLDHCEESLLSESRAARTSG